ncbi:hypothetical protein [Aquabacter spiritensis]|uniref:Secreted protein n=1 Tax=Aquabacter spiritensis TaxID=933073 RepID=A0A4R3LTQ7_9HYPH|nr:hypothetical protein [Aquabacter spiritensis]TCT03316.1 hypothetical protein EDC64_110181 [Aquabacter spiritensis]
MRMHTGVRMAVLAAALGAAAPAAWAQDFPNTLTMTCAEAKAMVNNSTGIVLSTGPNTFNRYVKDIAYCAGAQVTKEQWVPTRDVAQCAIGSTCVDPANLGGGR